jgi:phosphatidylinositol glycan class O
MQHLPNEIEKNDWDLIIAHFLGVDHCGHKHGPLHHEMERKLTEMNDIIKSVIDKIDDDTMLIVAGDHGMTITGDHGGSSDDETEALLFAYMKGRKFLPKSLDENNTDSMQQIDLTPTISTILGIPSPFSNLGTLKFQLLPDIYYEHIPRYQLLAFHLWHNFQQIRNYFITYSQDHERTFSYDDLNDFDTKFEIFEFRVNSLSAQGFESLTSDLRKSASDILDMCRNIWIKFNPKLMAQGMLLTFVGLFVAFILIYNIPLEMLNQVLNKKFLIIQAIASVFTGLIGYFLHFELQWDKPLIGFLFLSSLTHVLFFGFKIIQNWSTIADAMNENKNITNIVPRICFAFSVVVFFSNSFIVQEQRILCYLLSAQIIYAVWEIRRVSASNFKASKLKLSSFVRSTLFKITVALVSSIFLLRMSHNYFKCREEQGNCWDFANNQEQQNVSGKSSENLNVIPVIMLAVIVTIVRSFLKANGNLTGFAPHVLIMKFVPTISVIAASGYLILSQKQHKKPIVSYFHLDTLAWIVFASVFIEIIAIIVSPLLIYLLPRNDDKLNLSSNYNNMIPELYKHIRNVFNDKSSSKAQIPIVYGLATVYSSTFIAFGIILTVFLALLLGVDVCNGFVITLIVGFTILYIFTILRYESAVDLKQCLQPSFSLIVTWYLFYSYGFYSTSHQPTISQIDWNAAFVGRTSNFDHSNVISAIFVLLSTFNSNVIFLILYPLLIISPFMIYSIWPLLSMRTFASDSNNSNNSNSSKKNSNKDDVHSEYKRITLNDTDNEESTSVKQVSRGEVNLYENENLFLSSAFKVGCQLITLQGTKALASMFACTILCRHLMVWKIFAPRFIYEGIASYISFISIVFGFMLLIRVHASVKSLVNRVNKNC